MPRKILSILLVLLVIGHWSLVIPVAASNGDWLGIMMFVNGSPGSPATVSTGNAYLNPSYYRIDYNWITAQPTSTSPFRHNQAQDNYIANITSSGKIPLVSLFVGQGWMNANVTTSRSGPPTDLSATWNPAYGYSASYYAFVHDYATTYPSTKVPLVAIENEQNSLGFWNGTSEQYVRLIKTAYKAIKDTDPTIKVMDGGVVGDVWGGCIGSTWKSQDNNTIQPRTITMLNEFYHRHLLHGTYDNLVPDRKVDTVSEAQKMISSHASGCTELNLFLSEYSQPTDGHLAVDRINFHLYEDYLGVNYIYNWLTQDKNITLPIATNEIGLWDYATYDSNDQYAQDVFKTIISGQQKGVSPFIWFSADVCEPGHPYPCLGNDRRSIALVDTQSNPYQVRPAANTYKFLSTTLVSNPSTQYHGFWSDTGPAQITISNPFINSGVDIYSYTGQLLQHYPQVSNLSLTVSSPILVKWTRSTLPDLLTNWFSPSYDQTGDSKTNSLDFAKLAVR